MFPFYVGVIPTDTLQAGLQQWAGIAGNIVTIGGLVWVIFRFAVLRPLDRRISDATKQIQPGANGGLSLTDVHKKADTLVEVVDRLERRIARIEERHIDLYDKVVEAISRPARRRAPKVSEANSE